MQVTRTCLKCFATLQAAVCARLISSRRWAASFVQPTLALRSKTNFVPVGSVGILLPPQLCSDCLVSNVQHISDLYARRQLHCFSTSALIALRTFQATNGYHTAHSCCVYFKESARVRVSPSYSTFALIHINIVQSLTMWLYYVLAVLGLQFMIKEIHPSSSHLLQLM